MSILVNRPTKFVLEDVPPAVLGEAVLRAIRNGVIFVATPDEYESYSVVVGLREPPPPSARPSERDDRGSILPWLTAAVL